MGVTVSRKKLDARGRWLLRKLSPDAVVEILLRLEYDPDPAQLETLREAGCLIDSAAGNVLAARVSVGALARLAELPFVRSIQLSRDLFGEGS